VACDYFLTREILLKTGAFRGTTQDSCIILTSLGAEAQVFYGEGLSQSESFGRGQTIVLPAALGAYKIVGNGKLLYSYVPNPNDQIRQAWQDHNTVESAH
jgi:mannose-6-phosphate isomerase